MLGKRKAQRALFDVGNVFPIALDPASFHGQLARAAARLFRDEDFAAFYADRLGRPSAPPSLLALLTLLQHESGCSDAEAIARSAFDLRWAAVLRKAAGEPLCAKSTFQLFRAHLVLHDGVRTLFEQSIAEARRAGLLKGGALRVALDTKPILGRERGKITINCWRPASSNWAAPWRRQRGSPRGAWGGAPTRGVTLAPPGEAARQSPEVWAQAADLGRYFGPSVKGSTDLDWSDPSARNGFLAEIVTDARRLLRRAGAALEAAGTPAVREAAVLLEQLLLQDV